MSNPSIDDLWHQRARHIITDLGSQEALKPDADIEELAALIAEAGQEYTGLLYLKANALLSPSASDLVEEIDGKLTNLNIRLTQALIPFTVEGDEPVKNKWKSWAERPRVRLRQQILGRDDTGFPGSITALGKVIKAALVIYEEFTQKTPPLIPPLKTKMYGMDEQQILDMLCAEAAKYNDTVETPCQDQTWQR